MNIRPPRRPEGPNKRRCRGVDVGVPFYVVGGMIPPPISLKRREGKDKYPSASSSRGTRVDELLSPSSPLAVLPRI